MSLLARSAQVAASLLLVVGLRVSAQELSFLGGVLPQTDSERSSYTWEVDYVQDFNGNFAGSIAYINEGHLRAHHRDGTAFEAWARLPLFRDHLAISLGVGAYTYFDTQPVAGGDTVDVHGTTPIYSFSATAYLSDRWFGQILYNRITPAGQIKVATVTAGVGFWFGRDKKPTHGKLGDAPDEKEYVTGDELTLFAGQSVVNTFISPSAQAYAAEYRHGLWPHVDWTVSGIYEGDPEIVRRSGIATQLWAVNTFFHDRVAVGAGLGPYVYLDRRHPAGAGRINPAAVAPLVSLTLAVRLSDQWTTRMVFDRVATSYNRDADIFLLGLGYCWPR